MTTPVRLTAVLTHPIQYYAPWFRHIHAHAPELALTVVHATQPTPEQQGVGFDRAFEWDMPLTDGLPIDHRAGRRGRAIAIDSGSFTGLDVPEIGGAIADTSPDVVLITGWYSMTLVRALFACRRLGVPTLYRGDSHLLSGPRGWKRPFWTLKTRVLLRQFDGFLSPGVRVNEYLRWYGVPEHRIFQRAARGRQRDVRGGRRAVPRPRRARRRAPAVGHRSRRVRRAVCRQAGAVQAAGERRPRAWRGSRRARR